MSSFQILFEKYLVVQACTEPDGSGWILRAALNNELERLIRLRFANMAKEDLDHLCADVLKSFYRQIERRNERWGGVYDIPLSMELKIEDPWLVDGHLQLSRYFHSSFPIKE